MLGAGVAGQNKQRRDASGKTRPDQTPTEPPLGSSELAATRLCSKARSLSLRVTAQHEHFGARWEGIEEKEERKSGKRGSFSGEEVHERRRERMPKKREK